MHTALLVQPGDVGADSGDGDVLRHSDLHRREAIDKLLQNKSFGLSEAAIRGDAQRTGADGRSDLTLAVGRQKTKPPGLPLR